MGRLHQSALCPMQPRANLQNNTTPVRRASRFSACPDPLKCSPLHLPTIGLHGPNIVGMVPGSNSHSIQPLEARRVSKMYQSFRSGGLNHLIAWLPGFSRSIFFVFVNQPVCITLFVHILGSLSSITLGRNIPGTAKWYHLPLSFPTRYHAAAHAVIQCIFLVQRISKLTLGCEGLPSICNRTIRAVVRPAVSLRSSGNNRSFPGWSQVLPVSHRCKIINWKSISHSTS